MTKNPANWKNKSTCPTCGEVEVYGVGPVMQDQDAPFDDVYVLECDRCRVRDTYVTAIHEDGMLEVSAPQWFFITPSYQPRHTFHSFIDCTACKGRGYIQHNHRDYTGRDSGSTRSQCRVCAERAGSYEPRLKRRVLEDALFAAVDWNALRQRYEHLYRLRLTARGIQLTVEDVSRNADIVDPIREELDAERTTEINQVWKNIADQVDAEHPPTLVYKLEYPFVDVRDYRQVMEDRNG